MSISSIHRMKQVVNGFAQCNAIGQIETAFWMSVPRVKMMGFNTLPPASPGDLTCMPISFEDSRSPCSIFWYGSCFLSFFLRQVRIPVVVILSPRKHRDASTGFSLSQDMLLKNNNLFATITLAKPFVAVPHFPDVQDRQLAISFPDILQLIVEYGLKVIFTSARRFFASGKESGWDYSFSSARA